MIHCLFFKACLVHVYARAIYFTALTFCTMCERLKLEWVFVICISSFLKESSVFLDFNIIYINDAKIQV